MPNPTNRDESLPLLSPTPSSSSGPQPTLSPASRSKLGARRHISLPPTSEKSKGKQRALEPGLNGEVDLEAQNLMAEPGEIDGDTHGDGASGVRKKVEKGRRVTVIFSNEGKEGNLELWVEPGETVGSVKDQVSLLSSGGRIPLPSLICTVHQTTAQGELEADAFRYGIYVNPYPRYPYASSTRVDY